MLLKLSKFFLYASVFSVLVVLTSTFFPFIGGKYYFFRIAIELASIFFLLSWAFEANQIELTNRFRQISKQPLFIAVSIFVLFYLLASVFAYNPHGAFWSNFERGEGGFQMIHYYIFFVLLLLVFKSREEWKNIFKFSLVAAGLVIGYGILANLEIVKSFISPYSGGSFPAGWWHKLTEARFQGTLGNPAYVAPYLLFSMFYGAYLWVSSNWSKKLLKHLSFGSLIAFFLFFFILSQTRGAFIGLIAAILGGLIYLIINLPSLRKPTLIVLASLVVLGSLLVGFRHSSFVKSIPGGRIFEIFDLGLKTETIQTRVWTWNSAWAGFKDRPILGWGPENFSTAFDKYFDIRHYVPGHNSETWFDRAHSVLFDYLAETGFFGFLSYLGIFIIYYWSLFKKSKNILPLASNSGNISPDNSKKNSILRALVLALSIGYLVQALVLFDVLPIYLNLFLFLAFSVYQFSNYESES